jgi:hypothetical protein
VNAVDANCRIFLTLSSPVVEIAAAEQLVDAVTLSSVLQRLHYSTAVASMRSQRRVLLIIEAPVETFFTSFHRGVLVRPHKHSNTAWWVHYLPQRLNTRRI